MRCPAGEHVNIEGKKLPTSTQLLSHHPRPPHPPFTDGGERRKGEWEEQTEKGGWECVWLCMCVCGWVFGGRGKWREMEKELSGRVIKSGAGKWVREGERGCDRCMLLQY